MAARRNAYFDATDIALLAAATFVLVPVGAALHLMQISGGYGARFAVLIAFAPLVIRRMYFKAPARPPLRRGALASAIGVASVFAIVLGLLAVAVASWAASHLGDSESDWAAGEVAPPDARADHERWLAARRIQWEVAGGAGLTGFALLGIGVLLDRSRMVRRSGGPGG